MKTELSDNKEVRFFVLPLLAYSWRIFWKVTGFISEFEFIENIIAKATNKVDIVF